MVQIHSARSGADVLHLDNGFYVTGMVASKPVKFLVDCGATTSLMSSQTFASLQQYCNFSPTPVNQSFHTVNGQQMNVIGNVVLVVQLGFERYDITFVVGDIDSDGILGQDFLRKNVDNINYRKSCLVMGSETVPLETANGSSQICRVEVRETVKIPAQSRMWVPVTIPLAEHMSPLGFVEPDPDVMSTIEILTMSGIVDTQSENVLVNVVNYGSQPITIFKRMPLGTCKPYHERVQQHRIARVTEQVACDTLPEHLTDLFDRSSVHLNDQEKSELECLLSKYSSVFSKSSEDIGRTSLVEHVINTGSAAPIRQPPRRLPLGKRAIEKEEVTKMLERGIIEPSSSAWASPVVLVTKKDGSPRFCIDYRRLNDVTIKDAYPLPRVDDCIDSLSGAKYFSSLDLNSGYWQVGMSDADKEKTAFATTMGLYQFSVMSFGLANAPSTFERLMENVLRGLQWEECLLYMDDIVVPCSTVSEGLVRLEHILQRLRDANLKCKPSKCTLFQKEVKFLGHIVSETGISTDPAKIEAVQNWPTPKNAKEVKSFLGLCSYYRRFVKNFALIAKPLHKAADKSTNFEWSPLCEEAFQSLKLALTSSPVLGYPVPGAKFVLDTDASDMATGAVLSQVQNGQETVIAYYSKALNTHEKAYCVTRKELLAVINALKAFHSYLYGQPVHVRTDNAAVSWMKNLKHPTGQVARWLQELGTYNLEVTHRSGAQHRNADALSRNPCCNCARQQRLSDEASDLQETVPADATPLELNKQVDNPVRAVTRSKAFEQAQCKPSMAVLDGWLPADINAEQHKDPSIAYIMQALEKSDTRPPWQEVSDKGSSVKILWRMWDRLCVNRGFLVRKWHEDEHHIWDQIIVPSSRRDEVLYYFHDIPSGAHLGVEKTLGKIRQSFYWPSMREDTERYCSQCPHCISRKSSKPPKSPLGQNHTTAPLERCAVDIFGPLPRSSSGNAYVLVVCDCFTMWTEAIAIPNQEAKTIAKAFVDHYVSRFGVPLSIHSDQGTCFTSALFKNMCDLLGMKHTLSTLLHPQSNDMVERFNRTLATMLTMYCSANQRSWDQFLPQVLMAYRSSVNTSTQQTPNKMVFGREITLPLQACIGLPPGSGAPDSSTPDDYVVELRSNLEHIHDVARKVLTKKVAYRKRHYDLQAKTRHFQTGDPVWLLDTTRKPGVCSKLRPQWRGPYKLVNKVDDLVYLVKKAEKQAAKPIHVDRLMKFNGSEIPKWITKTC